MRNEKNGKLYLLLHSSANEFKNNYNGLYPVSGNWYFDNIKTYKYNTRYIRYIEGRDAELFYMISKNLIQFNEVRHNFISHVFLADYTKIKNITHYHHYGMPTSSSIVMGGHIVNNHEIAPVLSLPGEKIFLIKFNRALEKELNINDNSFLTPHGWGKRHKTLPKIILDIEKNVFTLDNESYKIEFGTSLRAHPNLELRDFQNDEKNRIDNFFSYLYQLYDCEIVDIFNQLASINKSGVIKW